MKINARKTSALRDEPTAIATVLGPDVMLDVSFCDKGAVNDRLPELGDVTDWLATNALPKASWVGVATGAVVNVAFVTGVVEGDVTLACVVRLAVVLVELGAVALASGVD